MWRLLNHFYPDWQVEALDPGRVQSSPSLSSLQKDGIYNRAGLIIPKKWKFTGGLYKELLKLANETSDEQLDKSALRHFFPCDVAKTRSWEAEQQPDFDSPPDVIGARS